MSRSTLLRLSAVAAIVGGALRVADGLLLGSATNGIQQFAYFFTDLFLMLGLCGIYLVRSNRLGIAGLLSFILSFTGFLLVRTATLGLLGFDSYLIGASITLLGVVGFGVAMLISKAFPILAPILWIVSLIIGAVGMLSGEMSWGATLAGVVFGVGFVVAGMSILVTETANQIELD